MYGLLVEQILRTNFRPARTFTGQVSYKFCPVKVYKHWIYPVLSAWLWRGGLAYWVARSVRGRPPTELCLGFWVGAVAATVEAAEVVVSVAVTAVVAAVAVPAAAGGGGVIAKYCCYY